MSPEDEGALFPHVIWFIYKPGKTKPENARLHLEGPDGPLKAYRGWKATEVWERLVR